MAGNQFKAIHRYARISARKVRLLANLVRGKTVVEALSILEYQPQRGAVMLKKVIESALGNAMDPISDTKVLKISDNSEVISSLYVAVLSRPPNPVELKQMREFLVSHPDRPDAIAQLVWALLSCNEFLINH